MLTESAARWLLVLHTALGVAAVGAATHLVIWMRGYLRGEYARHRSVRRFAVISLVLHALAFTAGNLMYPTYKVEVRTAYLENAGAIVAERSAHQAELDKIADRERAPRIQHPPAGDTVKRAARAARWFDVKEHWIALGLMASAALVFLLAFWDPRTEMERAPEEPQARSPRPGMERAPEEPQARSPRTDKTPLAPVALGLAVVIAGTVWLGAIIGVLTAASRAV